MQPGEKQEIIDVFRYEFTQFKQEQFQPVTESIKEIGQRDIAQDIKITENTTDIVTIKTDVKENKTSIGRLLGLMVSSLITILGVVLGIKFLTGG